MNEENIKKIIEDNYDVTKEDTVWTMIRDFYNKKFLCVVIVFWILMILFMAGLVYSGIKFFKTEQVQYQIMYSTIFISCLFGGTTIKIFVWLLAHRHGIDREIKRLELRIAELAETVKNK
jgi:hypothetical protein